MADTQSGDKTRDVAREGGGRKTLLNGTLAILAALSTALSLFVVYRSAAGNLGVAALGVYSLMVGLTTLNTTFDCGISLAMARQVARMRAMGHERSIRGLSYLGSACALLAPLICGIALVQVIVWVASKVLKESALIMELGVPCAVVVALNNATLALGGTLEGLERFDLKCFAVVIGNVLLIISAYFLVPMLGVKGIAFAFGVQAALVCLVMTFAVFLVTRELGGSTAGSARSILLEAVRVGIPLRIAGLAGFVFEPATRLFVGAFGGSTILGLYEAASRFCLQMHAVISSGLQVLLPRLAILSASSSRQMQSMVRKMALVTAMFGLLGLAVLVGGAVPLSLGLFSSVKVDFVYVVCLLSVAWMFHVLAVPAYFSNIADGTTRWNWLTQWVAVAGVLIMGPLLGTCWGWRAVIWAPAVSLVVATAIALIKRYQATKNTVIMLPWFDTTIVLSVAGMAVSMQLCYLSTYSATKVLWLFSGTALFLSMLAAFLGFRLLRKWATIEEAEGGVLRDSDG